MISSCQINNYAGDPIAIERKVVATTMTVIDS